MRLYLLPTSNRRTLLYCKRLNLSVTDHPSFIDRGTDRVAKLWSDWESKDSGWRKKVVDWGNAALKRIPYEEWGLKSIPPLSSRRRSEELDASHSTVEVWFPSGVIPVNEVKKVLWKLGTERESLHKSRMVYCFIGMPLSAPAAIIPVIPNLPFFYLVYRAWSHWRALSGSRHIQFLINENLIAPKASPILDSLYSPGVMKATRSSVTMPSTDSAKAIDSSSPLLEDREEEPKEIMLLGNGDSALIAEALEVPELHAELDRAIWQVQQDIQAKTNPRGGGKAQETMKASEDDRETEEDGQQKK